MWKWWEKHAIPSKSLYWNSYRLLKQSKMDRIVFAKPNPPWKLDPHAMQYEFGHLAKFVAKKRKLIYDQ